MNEEQKNFIKQINALSDKEILIKETGKEVVEFPFHSHMRHQIIYTLSGTLHVQIGDKSFFVPERHIAWIPPDTIHKLSSNNRQISLQIFFCSLPDATKERFTVYNSHILIEENLKFITSQAYRIHRNLHPELYEYCDAFLGLLAVLGKEYQTPLKAIILPEDKRLQAVLDYINSHLHENLCMERIATRFGFSVRNLSRLFRKSNIRFIDYLNYQRITRAIELFTEGHDTMEEISYEVGFNSPNHFNRVFKQILGTTPRSFCMKL